MQKDNRMGTNFTKTRFSRNVRKEGVFHVKSTHKWIVRVKNKNGRISSLKNCDTFDEAMKLYKENRTKFLKPKPTEDDEDDI